MTRVPQCLLPHALNALDGIGEGPEPVRVERLKDPDAREFYLLEPAQRGDTDLFPALDDADITDVLVNQPVRGPCDSVADGRHGFLGDPAYHEVSSLDCVQP